MKLKLKIAQIHLIISHLVWLTLFLSACGNTSENNVITTSQIIPAATANITAPPATLTPAAVTQTPSANLDWQDRWLSDIPCKLPCWEGITPGVTTLDEAQAILNKIPFITAVKKNTFIAAPDSVSWRWANTPEKGGGEVGIYPEKYGNKIIRIYPFYNTEYKFGDIIKKFGEPSHIKTDIVNYGNGIISYFIFILYIDRGFALKEESTKPFLLDKDTTFTRLTIFYPTKEALGRGLPETNSGLRVWEGFKGFNYYCGAVGFAGESDCSKVSAPTPRP